MPPVGLGIPVLRRDAQSAPSMEGRPDTADLLDKFGRIARDLRVSITSACSLRCTYCMPAEGLPVIPARDLLSADEIGRLVGIAVHDLGVREVRFTGGEPLTRPDLVDIIRASSDIAPGIPLAMTTNGIGLDRKAALLAAAGLTRINVSLDTIDREHFAAVTRRDRLPAVLRGLDAARAAGLGPIKINAVALRETLPDAGDLLAWALDNDVRLRFIEQMPLDADETWRRENLVSAQELLDELGSRFAPRRSASSRRSHGRSARPATAPASRPRAPCGPACSATTRPTCALCCAAGRRMPTSRCAGAARCGTSRPGTASTPTTSSGRSARWARSVADPRG
jgi:cyclic pyranopterin phosphate synthase